MNFQLKFHRCAKGEKISCYLLLIFCKQPMKNWARQVKGFEPDVEEIFKKYVWYGNLRELKNVIKRATLLTEGEFIEARTLPFEISNYSKLQFAEQPVAPPLPCSVCPLPRKLKQLQTGK